MVSYFLGEYLDILLLGIVIVINVLIGFLQEYSSKKTLEKLQSFIKSQSLVIRNSKREMIDSKLLVPGDILVLLKGDKVTADGIVLNANDFFVSEAFLTGESELINKNKKMKFLQVHMF
ncbi:MAG TPA: hypothetical protein PK957_03295 [Candidatus Dojkabacteria bacterium]|nr:hypothetical protein [Candidatus Dojkabacteria bacterium]HQF36954.1 hypothetical protein [Candidatus Dojkabacteria bacterium]